MNPDPETPETYTCLHCGGEAVETPDGLLLHVEETYHHLVRTAPEESPR